MEDSRDYNKMDRRDNPLAIVARYQAKPPVDLDAIARDLGINVYKENLGETISGRIIRDPRKGGRSGFAIYVNSTHHTNRQSFTLAHEIAHYVLHRDLIESGVVDDVMYRDSILGSNYESQANRMASDILIPIALVKKYKTENPQLDVDGLAKIFGVSQAAMKIKLSKIYPGATT